MVCKHTTAFYPLAALGQLPTRAVTKSQLHALFTVLTACWGQDSSLRERVLELLEATQALWGPDGLALLPSCSQRQGTQKATAAYTDSHFHEGEKAVGFSVVCFEDPQLKAEDSVGVSWEIRAAGPKNPSEG